ncbi:unnamed protein product [Cylicocyclus nassatus]|uniref:Uncharacterized protein n=1 Tax=Cylicocyclus nassatus TaxID=53992 RepID=A0AA36GNF5_CYLNA|nr:unnamed protein product [Cylicocyclus nassatus]
MEKETTQVSDSPRTSLQSGMTAYFTAQESLSDNDVGEESEVDLDATLRDIGDENFDMLDVTRPQSFTERSSPRLSSFRQGDPTVPKDSPLYAPISPNRLARPIPMPLAF